MNELLLDKKLALAVKYRLQPEDISALIDFEPVINTLKKGDREALLMADFVIKDDKMPDIKKAAELIYWKVKEEKRTVKISGIAWMDNGEIILFNREILEP